MLNIFCKKSTTTLLRSCILPPRSSVLLSRTLRTFAIQTRFTKEHEWIKYDDETNEGHFGITDHAQEELGDIVFIDLPFDGDVFESGEAIGAVESVKTSAQIYTPVDIEILENNEQIEENPELVNESPMDKGWISKVKITDNSNIGKLMTEAEYETYLKSLE